MRKVECTLALLNSFATIAVPLLCSSRLTTARKGATRDSLNTQSLAMTRCAAACDEKRAGKKCEVKRSSLRAAGCHHMQKRGHIIAPRERHNSNAAVACAIRFFRSSGVRRRAGGSGQGRGSCTVDACALRTAVQLGVCAHVAQDVHAHFGRVCNARVNMMSAKMK